MPQKLNSKIETQGQWADLSAKLVLTGFDAMISRPIVILLILTFFGCSTTGAGKQELRKTGAEAPIGVEIRDAFVTDGRLRVDTIVTPKADLPAAAIAVKLIGLKEGKILRESTLRGDQAFNSDLFPSHESAGHLEGSSSAERKVLRKGEPIRFAMVIDASDLTEYQIAGEWGDSLLGAAKLGEPSIVTPHGVVSSMGETSIEKGDLGVLIDNLHVDSVPPKCSTPPCDMLYTISGTLRNTTGQPAADLVIGLSLNWTEKGQEPSFPDNPGTAAPNEQEVVLENQLIEPYATRPIQITLDRALPHLASGRFVPHLRVLRSTPRPSFAANR